ncbi:hypothetical protein EDC01DRAFT_631282 [Geopyxis carbonaria]|nr:hypothetical protein EDC01DRAFT_631282 [Geopyxis carbonaria]
MSMTTFNPNTAWLALFQVVDSTQPDQHPEVYPEIIHSVHEQHILLLRRIAIEMHPDLAQFLDKIQPLDFTKCNRTDIAEAMQNFSDLVAHRLKELCLRIIKREKLLFEQEPELFSVQDPTQKIIEIFEAILWAEHEIENGSSEQATMLNELWFEEQNLRHSQMDFQLRDSQIRDWWEEIGEIRSSTMWDAAWAQMSMDIPSMVPDRFINAVNLLWPWIEHQEKRFNCSLKEYTHC